MFKGKLIENDKFYNLRSRQLLYIMLPAIAIGLLVNFYHNYFWISLFAAVCYLTLLLLTVINSKKMLKLSSKSIEIDENTIRLKTSSGNLIETIKIDQGVTIIVKSEYNLAHETVKDLREEMKGNVERHFLIIERGNTQRRFDFIIESHYMLGQLTKVINQWQENEKAMQYLG